MQITSALIGLPRLQKQFIVLACDITLALFATWMAFSLRLDTRHVPVGNQYIPYILSTVLFIPFFIRLGLYRAIFRYSGTSSLQSSAIAVALYGLVFFGTLVTAAFPGVPRSIGILQPILFFSLVFGSRVVASQMLKRSSRSSKQAVRILVYGAGEAGAQAAESFAMTRQYKVRGFLDDDPAKHGQRLNGLEIFPPSRAREVVEKQAITDILIALPSAGPGRRRQIIDSLIDLRVRVRAIPGILDLARGGAAASDIQELQIIDLLERAPLSGSSAEKMSDKTVLVTGAAGSIGSELCRQILQLEPARLVLFDHNEYGLYSIEAELGAIAQAQTIASIIIPCLGSVRDRRRLTSLFQHYRPDVAFHAAAYKHVPLVEANPGEAAVNNVIGTLNAALAAREAGVARFTLISTDKAVRPTNVMGASKRLAEQIAQALAAGFSGNTIFSIVRFGNVLDSSGSVVPLFRRQIAAGGPMTITHPEVTRYFMTIPEAASLVLESSRMAHGGEVFVLDMGEPVKIIDLARKMIRLSGLLERSTANPDGDIEIVNIGLRPGEKLYEELLIGENPQATSNPHIMMAREDFIPWKDLEKELAQLEDAVLREDVKALVDVFRRTVSGFTGQEGVTQDAGARRIGT